MLKQIEEMPKVVLHLHLDGSLRPETVQEWIKEMLGKDVSLENVRAMLMVDKDCRDLNQYLEKFDLPAKVLQTKEHIERATYELYEDLARQNVKYAEVRYAPSKHLKGGLSLDEVVEASISGLDRAKKDLGIDGGLILCAMRGDDEETHKQNLATIETAKKYLGKGVCAVDLAGAEALFKTSNFEDVFSLAREQGIPMTIHAGEADGPESIRTALSFGAKRIGHGVRCIEDEALMDELAEKKIPLEVCPISNMQTQAVTGKHPLEQLYRRGLATTISTDNNTVSNTNILEEYDYVLKNSNLRVEDLINMNETSARNIFGTEEQKQELVSKIEEYRKKEKQKEKSIDE